MKTVSDGWFLFPERMGLGLVGGQSIKVGLGGCGAEVPAHTLLGWRGDCYREGHASPAPVLPGVWFADVGLLAGNGFGSVCWFQFNIGFRSSFGG